MDRLNRWLDKVDNFFSIISGGTIFLMMVWIFLDVILRYFFKKPIVGTMEITGEYILVIIVFLAISFTQKQNEHINVDILYRNFSKGVKKILGIISNLPALCVFIILGINNFQEGLKYISNDMRSVSLLDYPLAPALMIISFGILLLSVRLLLDSIQILRNKKEFQ